MSFISSPAPLGVKITGRLRPGYERVLTPDALAFVVELQRKFGTKITIHPLRAGRPGQLVFEYYDTSDLTRLYDQLMRE